MPGIDPGFGAGRGPRTWRRAVGKAGPRDYAEALLQIAIVLISVTIVAEQVCLVYVGGGLGIIGAILMINGYLLLVELPLLS